MEVCGQAKPDLPGGQCGIVICEVGPNGIPEPDTGNPADPCGGDDENLNQGGPVGSDSTGRFCVDLDRELMDGDAIYAVDTCSPAVGGVLLVIDPAPAPVLSNFFTAVALAVLTLIAFVGVTRMRRAPSP
jgi:hypothetical protein